MLNAKNYQEMLDALKALDAIVGPHKGAKSLETAKTRNELAKFTGFLIKQKKKAEKLEKQS